MSNVRSPKTNTMARTALLIIDIQRGAFDGIRCGPIDGPEILVNNALSLLNAARESGAPIVLIQHCDAKGKVFEEGSVHWELHEALAPQHGETVLQKYESSAFEGTNLAGMLEGMNATELVLCGLQSEHCVSNTAKAALSKGFAVTIAQDGHSTWPSAGRSANEIKEQVNHELTHAGAGLSSVSSLVASLRAA